MIQIYKPQDVNMAKVLANSEFWDYPISELDYLQENGSGKYVLFEGRLYEINDDCLEFSYRGYNVEYIDYMENWRLFRSDRPQDTIVYLEGTPDDVRRDIDDHEKDLADF